MANMSSSLSECLKVCGVVNPACRCAYHKYRYFNIKLVSVIVCSFRDCGNFSLLSHNNKIIFCSCLLSSQIKIRSVDLGGTTDIGDDG